METVIHVKVKEKTVGSVLLAIVGLIGLYCGFALLLVQQGQVAMDAVRLFIAIACLAVGALLCWHAVGRHAQPPEEVNQVVNFVCLVCLGGALLAVVITLAGRVV